LKTKADWEAKIAAGVNLPREGAFWRLEKLVYESGSSFSLFRFEDAIRNALGRGAGTEELLYEVALYIAESMEIVVTTLYKSPTARSIAVREILLHIDYTIRLAEGYGPPSLTLQRAPPNVAEAVAIHSAERGDSRVLDMYLQSGRPLSAKLATFISKHYLNGKAKRGRKRTNGADPRRRRMVHRVADLAADHLRRLREEEGCKNTVRVDGRSVGIHSVVARKAIEELDASRSVSETEVRELLKHGRAKTRVDKLLDDLAFGNAVFAELDALAENPKKTRR